MHAKHKPNLNAVSKIQKRILLNLFLFLPFLSHGQITLTSSDFPTPGVEYPYSRKSSPGAEIDFYTNNGSDIVWDFSSITKTEQSIVRFLSPTSSEIQYLCIAIFNNPMDPEHDSNVARPGEGMTDPTGNMQITNAFDFYQLSADAYVNTGRSANVNSLPTCIKTNPLDTIFKLPFHFEDTITSYSASNIQIPGIGYYGQTLHRHSVADAWGTVITPYGSFSALRIMSTLEYTDSIYYESYNFGMKIPHTETHYLWLTNDHTIPVFSVEEKGQNFGGTIAFWIDTLDHTSLDLYSENYDFIVFPSPATNYINVVNNSNNISNQEYIIYDITGHEITRFLSESASITFSIKNLVPGIYFITNGNKTLFKKLIKN